MTASRTNRAYRWDSTGHWRDDGRFDTRRAAELEAHTTGRRRD
ncbi:hypothetical protein [Roseovarius salinarum]|nr:hypothetical protein [Roseovarius salinarum]